MTSEGSPPSPSDAPTEVSVVIPVRNEERHLGAVLEDLLGQDYPEERVEILVVDGDSEDGTRALVERAMRGRANLRLLHNPARLSSAARALGVAKARGRYLIFVDGHCRIPSRTLLTDMVRLFERTGADCLARPQFLVAGEAGPRGRAISAARHSPFGHSGNSEIYRETEGPVSPVSSGAMYRREVFERVGNFDVSFDACEDVELNWRVEQAGLRSWSSPRLRIDYEPRRTFRALFRQMHRYGVGRARLHRKHPKAFTPESLVPALFTLYLVGLVGLGGLATLGVARGGWWALGAVPALLYAGLGAVFARRARRGDPTLATWDLWRAFLTIHLGLGAGYLRGWLPK